MQFYLAWIILLAITLWVGILALLWGLQSGQFSDQNRARFLALSAEKLESEPRLLWKGRERYAFLLISAAILAVLCAAAYIGLTGGRPG